MKVDKLFQVLVVAGASSTVGLGLGGCGDDDEAPAGTGGAAGSGGSSSGGSGNAGGGAKASGGTAGAGGGPVTGGSTSSGGTSSSGGASSGGSKATGGTSSGEAASGGASSGGSGGASSSGGKGSSGPDADACEARCGENPENDSWTDCGGCCCWLAAGKSGAGTSPICPATETCCIGRGRD